MAARRNLFRPGGPSLAINSLRAPDRVTLFRGGRSQSGSIDIGGKDAFLCPALTPLHRQMANLVHRRQFTIEWGHCDPAGIVSNSRFFEFFDWNAWLLFEAALGVRPRDLAATFGIYGLPLVDARARFAKPARFNDVAEIASEVAEFRRSSFEVLHRIFVDRELAVEGSETRVWAGRDPSDPERLKGVPIPPKVRERFQA